MEPPVVILSMPRSGSSWVGEILGSSSSSLYLREPITQTHIKTRDSGPSFFEFNIDHLPDGYESAANYVFSGLPLFDRWITIYPKQWALSERSRKRIVIKEVNPFMLNWLIKNYKPRIIYLIRHPAATADSFNRLGYNGKQIEVRFSEKTLKKYPNYPQYTNSFWSDHGAMQAMVINETIDQITNDKDFRLVQYEHLCENPVSVFKELYDFAELKWDSTIENQILNRSQPETVDTHDFSTQRNSTYEMGKWKSQLPQDAIDQVKNAWLSFDPPYYGLSDW